MSIHDVAVLVRFNLTLLLVYLLMKTCKNVCVIKAFLKVVDSTMDQHFVTATHHQSNMAFSWRWGLT